MLVLFVSAIASSASGAGPLVPGTGKLLYGDNFEDSKWTWQPNLPKGSSEDDGRQRTPAGVSSNSRWFEGALRGAPDVVKRVDTPEGGLENSHGSLLLQTLQSKVPGRPSFTNGQDDFVCNVQGALHGPIDPSRSPSCVVRVFLPPWDKWEKRTGNSFGFRAGARGTKVYSNKSDEYWPGMFIFHYSPADSRQKEDSAALLIRGDKYGRDFTGLKITETGWWTLGMSFTPEGMVHFYARKGVENLTAKDLLSSQWPYSLRCEVVNKFFFNVINRDDGKSWSTPWVIDDPFLYGVR